MSRDPLRVDQKRMYQGLEKKSRRNRRQTDKALAPNKPEGLQELGFRNEAVHRDRVVLLW